MELPLEELLDEELLPDEDEELLPPPNALLTALAALDAALDTALAAADWLPGKWGRKAKKWLKKPRKLPPKMRLRKTIKEPQGD